MPFPKNHDHIYFDKLRRTKKAETVLSMIYATYVVKTQEKDSANHKKLIAKKLKDAYSLFIYDRGTYSGSEDQFDSQYTIGHELGIWKNSELDLTDKARDVAEGRLTIKEYFDIAFLNYIQPINGKIVHLLYNVLKYAKEKGLSVISKDDIKKSFPGMNNTAEHINSLYSMFLATNYFSKNEDDDLLLLKDVDTIIDCCNIEYVDKEYDYVKEIMQDNNRYLDYLLDDHRSENLLLNKKGGKIMPKRKMADNPRNGGDNVIYYGAPGCGKSYKVKKDLENISEDNKFRVTFHPEYTNSDFVGQILPVVENKGEENEKVKYVFNPGPFTEALERALSINEPVFLIIEEINRGNAAAIFGDLFQLLDRQKARKDDGSKNEDYGKSEYSITNPNMEEYLKEKIDLPNNFKIYIPRNMRIRATMNSSDQNVFTLDTAFKRRWDFEQISNEFNAEDRKRFDNLCIPGTNVTWEKFLSKINPEILKYKIRNNTNEDKQIGKYFVDVDCLTDGEEKIEKCKTQANRFAYKVLEYLWNDVCKIDKDTWFDTEKYKTLEELIKGFIDPKPNQNPLSVFKEIDFNKE